MVTFGGPSGDAALGPLGSGAGKFWLVPSGSAHMLLTSQSASAHPGIGSLPASWHRGWVACRPAVLIMSAWRRGLATSPTSDDSSMIVHAAAALQDMGWYWGGDGRATDVVHHSFVRASARQTRLH